MEQQLLITVQHTGTHFMWEYFKLLGYLNQFMGWNPDGARKRTHKYAQDWPLVNYTAGKHLLKSAYDDGHFHVISRRFPVYWKMLKEAEPELRPFLEQVGYRNLGWWS